MPKKEPPKQPSSLGNYLLLLLLLGGGGYGGYWYFVVRTRPSEAVLARAAARSRAGALLGEHTGDTSKYVDPSDLTPVRNARACMSALQAALESERSALLSFETGPMDSTATDRATQRKVRAWHTFVNRWNAKIAAATRNGEEFLYPPGTHMGSQMETVTNQIQAALSVMRDIAPRAQVRPQSQRESDLSEAAGFLNAAGTVLTNLPK